MIENEFKEPPPFLSQAIFEILIIILGGILSTAVVFLFLYLAISLVWAGLFIGIVYLCGAYCINRM